MWKRPLVWLVPLAVLAAAGVHAQGPYDVAASPPDGFDRARAQRDALVHLRALIALDTQNPPGNEILTATYLDSQLSGAPGIESTILDPGNGRANLIVRLRATKSTARPVIVMGHMDVVGADPSRWSTPPFEPTEIDGYLHGRGAIDDKGMLAAAAAAIRQLTDRRDRLRRDVILVATAAEEGGTEGIERVIASHRDLLGDAEFAINEGGRVRLRGGTIASINVQVTEKVSYTVVATARADGGHASVPLPGNAIAALARALARVHAWEPAVRLNATTREYFRRLAGIEPNVALRDAMIALSNAGDQAGAEAAAAVLSRDPLHNAVLRTGVSLTMIEGGIRSNVIPSEARATLNVRVLPDGDILADVAELNRVGAEPSVTFALRGQPQTPPPSSPVTTALFEAMEAAGLAMAPGAAIVPFMSTGATDGAALRAIGIPTYGILPLPLEMEDELRMHGDNERVPIPALGWAAEYLYRVLAGVGP